MEKYLIDEYNVYEDEEWLTEENIIENYFKDEGRDFFDCGQGYCENEVNIICKIDDKFYNVHIEADINSSKQEYGDRLYWVESINSVTYKEIEKPQPKEKIKVVYELELTKEQKSALEYHMNKLHINTYSVKINNVNYYDKDNNLIGKLSIDIPNVHMEDGKKVILPNSKGNYAEIVETLNKEE